MPDGAAWPRLSVVTPSYNQGIYLEETIRSVLLQGYPNLQYVIIDGGSSDTSIDIIEKYKNWFFFWCSEDDDGQAQAINKGLKVCDGDLITWINSDDWYGPRAFERFSSVKELGWAVGECIQTDKDGNAVNNLLAIAPQDNLSWFSMFARGETYLVAQPSVVWRNPRGCEFTLNENYHYAFDHIMFMQILKFYGPPSLIEWPISYYRLHESSKTCTSYAHFRRERAEFVLNNIVGRRFNFRNFISYILAKCTISQIELEIFCSKNGTNCNLQVLLMFAAANPFILLSRFYLGALRRGCLGRGR